MIGDHNILPVEPAPLKYEKREARLIVPKCDNDGHDLADVLSAFETMLCRQFGGFTRAETWGGWYDDKHSRVIREASFAYDIACDLSQDTAVKLRHLAVGLLRDARQLAIYLRYPNGFVELVD